MPETAESHSHHLTTNRNCTIEVNNVSSVYCLNNPKVYMDSGFCHSPPQPTVRSTRGEVCSFTKDDNTASGAVGVMTYELFHMSGRRTNQLFAVMFSVPFDYNFYKNWLAVGIFPSSQPCDKDLYELMYNNKDFVNFNRQEANGSGLLHEGDTVEIRATMSDHGRAIIKLEVYDKLT